MAPVTNGRVLFTSVPSGLPIPGQSTIYDTSELIDPDNVPLDGGFLLKTLELSIEPYMTTMMRGPGGKYLPAYEIGKPTTGPGVAMVVRSEHADVKAGEHLLGLVEHVQYAVRKDLDNSQVIDNKYHLSWSTFTGVLGVPGRTAYMGWKGYSHAKAGQVVFVSVGAGCVGSLVIQLAKADGLKVIASTGSDEGKAPSTYTGITRVERRSKLLSTTPECGMISGYNTGGAPVRNLLNVVSKSITMTGFVVYGLYAKYTAAFYAEVMSKFAKGEIKHREHVYDGLERAGEAIRAVHTGENKGKAVVHVADD
ncbi:unnamed protein product [Cyclocybe aegerita]|uniref:Oxidoreductase N-terminal domain-containing protein n=1 Tax=Cyclocybe aegerita TaxID=1973307 RepID=A0A8S0WBS1_CYCAE|nr:unnamed protein product [Cyclocybe aegerita]